MKYHSNGIISRIIIIYLSFHLSDIYCQQAFTSAGGNASSIEGSVSYSLGQIVYTTHKNSTGTIIQGIQVPYETIFITELENQDLDLEFSVMPNPTTDYVRLEVKSFKARDFFFNLYNIYGQILQVKKITEEAILIDMVKYPPSVYYLQIFYDKNIIKVFKILKN